MTTTTPIKRPTHQVQNAPYHSLPSIYHYISKYTTPSSNAQFLILYKTAPKNVKNSERNNKNRILEHGISSICSLSTLNFPSISISSDFSIFLNFLVSVCFLNSISMERGSEPQVKKNVYSVWALPQEDLKPRLKKLMEGLRSEFGGPEFEPHVTVVGAISLTETEALDKFKKACNGLKGYTAKVEKVATGSFFYQCVYLLLHATPEVVGPSDHCCGHFCYMPSAPYMPHLSLLYGDLSDEEKKKAQEKAYILDENIGSLELKISRLALYKTDIEDKSLKSWEKVAECNLE